MSTTNLIRKPNETDFEFHKRIIYGKLVDKTLVDVDYTELSELAYGQPYSSDVARRMFYGSKRTLEMIGEDQKNRIGNDTLLSELDEKMIELRKERQKFYDHRNAFQKIIRERSRQEELNELIVGAIQDGSLPSLTYVPSATRNGASDLLVSLNDLHYGANHRNYWNEYNSDIAKEMLSYYLDRILSIAEVHGCENCIVCENGDAISGSIHKSIQLTNKENVIEQVVGVSELIASFLAALSPHFNRVEFLSVSGNHSRLEENKDSALIEERMDDLIEWYLKARLQNFENIIVGAGEKIDPTMYLVNIRGKNYLGVHGDFDGSASKVQSLQTMVGKPLYAVLSGHLHHNKVDEVQGVKTVMAGSFLGMDDYCVQKRIVGRPEQMACVCNEDGILCHYGIPLKRKTN